MFNKATIQTTLFTLSTFLFLGIGAPLPSVSWQLDRHSETPTEATPEKADSATDWTNMGTPATASPEPELPPIEVAPPNEMMQLRLYEGGDFVPVDERDYTADFPITQTRRVHAELGYQRTTNIDQQQAVSLTWRYYNPDGSLRGESTESYLLEPGEAPAYITSNWGWAGPGYWPLGTYRVEAWEGDTLLASTTFEVTDDRALYTPTSLYYPSDTPQLELLAISTYESGATQLPYGERDYRTEFPKSTTRYINWELALRNHAVNVQDHTYTITWKYYLPGGVYEGEGTAERSIGKDFSLPDLSEGRGWSSPGNWAIGTHRIEIYVNGTFFAEREFTIVDDREQYVVDGLLHPAQNPGIEFEFLNFYDVDVGNPELNAVAGDAFPQSTTDYIYAKIQVINLMQNVQNKTYNLSFKYYSPDGSLFGEVNEPFGISRDWGQAWYYTALGFQTKGRWQVGEYRVELWIDGVKFAERSFTIYDDS